MTTKPLTAKQWLEKTIYRIRHSRVAAGSRGEAKCKNPTPTICWQWQAAILKLDFFFPPQSKLTWMDKEKVHKQRKMIANNCPDDMIIFCKRVVLMKKLQNCFKQMIDWTVCMFELSGSQTHSRHWCLQRAHSFLNISYWSGITRSDQLCQNATECELFLYGGIEILLTELLPPTACGAAGDSDFNFRFLTSFSRRLLSHKKKEWGNTSCNFTALNFRSAKLYLEARRRWRYPPPHSPSFLTKPPTASLVRV